MFLLLANLVCTGFFKGYQGAVCPLEVGHYLSGRIEDAQIDPHELPHINKPVCRQSQTFKSYSQG